MGAPPPRIYAGGVDERQCRWLEEEESGVGSKTYLTAYGRPLEAVSYFSYL